MTQVSKYPISKDVYERIYDVFLRTLVDLKTKEEVDSFLKEFLSPTEQIMLAKRLAIALLLAKGYDYRQTAKILRVSTSTVGAVGILYKYGGADGGYKKVINRLLKDEKIEEFWQNAAGKILNLVPDNVSKGQEWVYLKKALRKRKYKNRKPF